MFKHSNPFLSLIGNVVIRAVEGAAEAVLDEAQDKLTEINDRVSKAKKNVKSRRSKYRYKAAKKEDEILEGEVIDVKNNQ